MIKQFFFLFLFILSSQVTAKCVSERHGGQIFENELIEKVSFCRSGDGKESKNDISMFCNCEDLMGNNDYSKSQQKNFHDQFIANQYQKHFTKVMYSISSDINILDGNLSEIEEEDLNNSCGINALDNIADECADDEDSYLYKLGGKDAINKFKDQFSSELSARQKPHLNTGNQCSETSKGYIERCNPVFKADCNMSDNLADKIYMDTSIKKLTLALIGYSNVNGSSLNEDKDFYSQAEDSDFEIMPDDENSILSKLEGLESNSYLNEIIKNPKNTLFLKEILENISTLKKTGHNLLEQGSDEYFKILDLVTNKISSTKSKEIEIKCKTVYKKAKDFFCSSTKEKSNELVTLKPSEFMSVISDDSENGFGASKYYCNNLNSVPSNDDEAISRPKDLVELLYSAETNSGKVDDMAKVNYSNQSQKVRGTDEEPMLCSDIYGPIYKEAKAQGLVVDNPTSPKEKTDLYGFQLEKYSAKFNTLCVATDEEPKPEEKDVQKCDYFSSLISITTEKLSSAKSDLDNDEAEELKAKEEGRLYIAKDYTKIAQSKSLAQRVLLGSTPDKKETTASQKIEVAKKEESEKDKAVKTVESAPVNTSTDSTYKALSAPTVEQEDTSKNSDITSSNTGFTGLTLSASAPDKYWNKKSEQLSRDIAAAKEKIASMSYQEVNEKKEEYKAKRNNEVISQLSSALTPDDYIEEQAFINKHTMQDEGTSSVSDKIEKPSTYDLRTRQNKVLNETINNKYLASDDSIEADEFYPRNSDLINKHGLVDTNGNVLSLMEIKIKGSIEENFTKVLEKDEDKLITKDRKMILSDPNQFKQFKILAKALEKKETFLISRHDNEDIKLIVKYNNVSREYTVEPFADKERLIQYEADYTSFQENISNAIKDKTFDTLMKKYKED